MSKTRTLLQLRTEIRDRGEISSNYIDDTQLNRMINVAYLDFYDFALETNPELIVATSNITISSNDGEYNLTTEITDFYRLLGVDVQDGSEWFKLNQFNWAERNRDQNSGLDKRNTRYRIMGSNLQLVPVPDWSGTIRIWYAPTVVALSLDGDTMEGYNGWEEYVVLHALIQYAAKTEEDATLYAAQMNAMKERIRAFGSSFDDGEPNTVRDIWAEESYHPNLYPKLPLP